MKHQLSREARDVSFPYGHKYLAGWVLVQKSRHCALNEMMHKDVVCIGNCHFKNMSKDLCQHGGVR